MKLTEIIAILFVIFHASGNCSPLIDLFNSHKNDLMFNNKHSLNSVNNNNNLNFFNHNNNKIEFENDNNNNNNNGQSLNEDTNDNTNNNTVEDESDFDTSIFGNTDESFFEFANRRVAELQNLNNNLFEKAIGSCPYAPVNSNEDSQTDSSQTANRFSRSALTNENENCVVGSLNFENFYGKTSDRLFLFDFYTIGLISSSDSTLRLYNFNIFHRTLSHVRTKYFRNNEVPHDACADKYKSIFVVFPDQNKIAKLVVNQNSTSKNNKSQTFIREVFSIKDADFRPSAIACHDDLVYVSERPKNQIRIYDRLLRLVRIIYLNGVIVSNHRALAVNQNVRVLLDGMDSLALFNPPLPFSHLTSSTASIPNMKNAHRKKYSMVPENNRINVCHFYKNMNCLEDVHVAADSTTKTKSNIFTVDSCNSEIKQFLYSKDEKITLINRFLIKNGRPISVITNQLGYIFVLTDLPRKIYILDPRECNNY